MLKTSATIILLALTITLLPAALLACVSCHPFEQKMLARDGGAHGRELACDDCHPNHPPTGEATYHPCSQCHTGDPHYALNDCHHCHTDPHRPLVTLRDPLKPARQECLSCHDQVGAQMDKSPGKHAQLFCNRCHSRHKQLPTCLDCHQPHQNTQQDADCEKCHPPHTPQAVILNGYVPAGLCRPCHLQQANDLAATLTNHGGINCTYCHAGQHPTVPKCQDCHGLPHSQAFHNRHRDCLQCHGDPHDLISHR